MFGAAANHISMRSCSKNFMESTKINAHCLKVSDSRPEFKEFELVPISKSPLNSDSKLISITSEFAWLLNSTMNLFKRLKFRPHFGLIDIFKFFLYFS